MGAYVVPVSTFLVLSAVLEVDPLFPVIGKHLLHRFFSAYAPVPSIIVPLGPDNSDCFPVGWVPERMCQDLTFVGLDSAARLLDMDYTITHASQLLFPLLAGRAPLFK